MISQPSLDPSSLSFDFPDPDEDELSNIDLRANFQLALKCLTLKDFIFCDITASFRPLFS